MMNDYDLEYWNYKNFLRKKLKSWDTDKLVNLYNDVYSCLGKEHLIYKNNEDYYLKYSNNMNYIKNHKYIKINKDVKTSNEIYELVDYDEFLDMLVYGSFMIEEFEKVS